jgi:tryptophanyl-tRNA synthetase
MSKEVILTGLRSNAAFHIGNYLGAILPTVQLQHGLKGQYQLNMFVPDLHSFTTPVDHTKLFTQTVDNLKVYAAAGLDIDDADTFIYRQSFIPAHSEMTWILSCFAYFGELSRMTQFKEKSVDKQDNITSGLFIYPVLMAADILLYGAKWVPVGEDQRQHLELARDLAIRFNNKFGETFSVPNEWSKQLEFVGIDKGTRIRSLKNPNKKMSKSIDDPSGTIMLNDNLDDAKRKIMTATTDSEGSINYDWDKQPGITNLLQILALLTTKSQDDINKQWTGRSSYGDLKAAVADAVVVLLSNIQSKLENIEDARILKKLEANEKAMQTEANATLAKAQQAVGLRK